MARLLQPAEELRIVREVPLGLHDDAAELSQMRHVGPRCHLKGEHDLWAFIEGNCCYRDTSRICGHWWAMSREFGFVRAWLWGGRK